MEIFCRELLFQCLLVAGKRKINGKLKEKVNTEEIKEVIL
jgi:hypothetical protein